MLDGVRPQIYIEVWPVEMAWGRLFNIQDFPHRSILEPWEIVVRKEILRII
jgi:hypothetical protein